MRIGIFVKRDRRDFADRLGGIVRWLKERDCQVEVDERVAAEFGLPEFAAPGHEIAARSDFVIAFGGDGTLLSVARLVAGATAPILGVNLGTLGFLTGVTAEEIYEALDAMLTGKYRLDRRRMLKAEIVTPKQDGCYHALNDLVINNKGTLARMISVDVTINGDFTSQFQADGIIISTPTGSTAYSLSAGGPIVCPALNATILTPICPHTLTHRPLVLPAEASVMVTLRAGEDVTLTIDGQVGVGLDVDSEIICTESEYQIDLVQPTSRSFFDVLRQKLKWGERWQSR